ncbi:MAG: aspartate aminotransferase family protein [Gemmatimonadota bacterium]
MAESVPLQLSPEAMRALGYRAVDLVVDHLTALPDLPVGRRTDPATLAALLDEPPPETGRDPDAVLERLRRDVLDHTLHVNHPRFFAFVPSPGNYVGAVGELLAAGFNVFAGTWFGGSGAAALELVTLGWLRDWCGLPATAGGLLVSGGSVANLTALAVARQARLPDGPAGAVVYDSDQTHSAVDRALRVLGFAPDQLRRLSADAAGRLPVAALAAEVAADRAAGRTPFCVVANAGTVNTGAVDPLPELADFCRDEGLWLHADAAYGGGAVLCPAGRAALRGLERVDSLALDPHKWLFQPFEMGCVLVREERHLSAAFDVRPEYLRDVHRERIGEVNFGDRGIQLTRSARAIKLWLSIQVFGLQAFRDAVAVGLAHAELAERVLRESGGWEIVTPAQLGIVTFRAGDDRVTAGLVESALADGFALLSSTRLGGRPALRLCTINPRTTEADIRETVARLGDLAARLE